jgi:hypothetical protein
MALIFPSSPSDGQIYTDTTTGNRYVYNSTVGVWSFAANNVGMSVSSTPPANVAPGALWYNREIGRTFLYYDDGDSKQWVETVPATGSFDSSTVASYANVAAVIAVAPAFAKANAALPNTTNAVFQGNLTITGALTIGQNTVTITETSLNVANAFIVSSQSVVIPSGNTAQRPTNAVPGTIRFNTSTGRLEQTDGSSWATIDAPPQISGVSPTITPANAISSNAQTLVISGNGFTNPPSVRFIGTNNVEYAPTTVTFNSTSQITAIFYDADRLTGTYEPYGVKVTNSSGLASTLSSILYINDVPTWSNASGFIANTINLDAFTPLYIVATDPESNGITYTVESGSLPTGLSLSANGYISGTANVVNSSYALAGVTYNATCGANDGINKTQTRVFSILHKWRDGSTSDLAAVDAISIKNATGTSTSGLYYIKNSLMTTAVQVYCDMSYDSGGYMLLSYGYLSSTSGGSNMINLNADRLSGTNWSYDPTNRASSRGIILTPGGQKSSVYIANKSTYMIMAAGGNPSTGGIDNYSYVYRFAMPTPSALTFTNATYGTYDDDQSNATVTVTGLKGDIGTWTRYTKNKSIMVSWGDTFPSGYGAIENSNPMGNVTWDYGPFFPSMHAGSGSGRGTPSNATTSSPDIGVNGYQQGDGVYAYRGWYGAGIGVNNTGQMSIWVK